MEFLIQFSLNFKQIFYLCYCSIFKNSTMTLASFFNVCDKNRIPVVRIRIKCCELARIHCLF